MSEKRLELLLEAVQDATKIVILPHNDPDPDAIASAVALQYLLVQKTGIACDIAYKGIIGRAENRALVRYLNYPLYPLMEDGLNLASHMALVDTQPGAGNNPWAPGYRVALVMDHHPWREATTKASFFDVRPEIGSASTILLEYVEAAKLELPASLATALFYGIKTDTRGLSRGVSPADIVAYFHLQSRIDGEALTDIERAQVPAAYFRSFAATLEATQLYNDVAISYIGPMEYPDMAAEMADLLSRLEEVGWLICIGVYQDMLILAVRAPGQKGGAGQLVQAIVGQDGTAGGHGTMAGGQVLLRQKRPELIVRQLTQRALQYLSIGTEVVPHALV